MSDDKGNNVAYIMLCVSINTVFIIEIGLCKISPKMYCCSVVNVLHK